MSSHHVLGFSCDDIIGGWQDSRLAEACTEAWNAEGKPPGFVIFQGAGEGEYFIHWYLGTVEALVLDRHKVEWRQFRIGERADVPRGALPVLILGE
jgi:hypothetical protein